MFCKDNNKDIMHLHRCCNKALFTLILPEICLPDTLLTKPHLLQGVELGPGAQEDGDGVALGKGPGGAQEAQTVHITAVVDLW